jgi:hypothetical protein
MPRKDDEVAKLYYQVVKMYELPVRNHLHVKKKITELRTEIGEFRACHYLATLLRRDLRTEEGEFKPALYDSLDPYTKRLKIEAYFTRTKPKKVWTAPTKEELADREAKRQKQFEE